MHCTGCSFTKDLCDGLGRSLVCDVKLKISDLVHLVSSHTFVSVKNSGDKHKDKCLFSTSNTNKLSSVLKMLTLCYSPRRGKPTVSMSMDMLFI